MKVYVVCMKYHWHAHATVPISAHSSKEDAEFFNETSKKLSSEYWGHVVEVDLDPPISQEAQKLAKEKGIDIPDRLTK